MKIRENRLRGRVVLLQTKTEEKTNMAIDKENDKDLFKIADKQ